MKNSLSGFSREGNFPPRNREKRRKASCSFYPEDLVLVLLNHRLAQLSLRLLREELWKLDDVRGLNRVAVRSVKGLEQPAVLVYSRLVITGGDHYRLHEELTLSDGLLCDGQFKRFDTVHDREEQLAASVPLDDVPDRCLAVLKERFAQHEKSIIATYEARSK